MTTNLEEQTVKLIFAAKQKVDTTKTLRVSIKDNWLYFLDGPPAKTIGFTLRKFKLASIEEAEEQAKKYRVYRVREDPKTRYRYVTEILNQEEGRQLINKRNCQILVAHHSLVKNPQEDFKNLLDTAERKLIRQNEQKKGMSEDPKEDQNSQDDKRQEPPT